MEKKPYDQYYRNSPSSLVPVRPPFTRPGRADAGHVFIYLTNMWKRWSLLLDETRAPSVYQEARQCVPHGISQFWLLEKRYSTFLSRGGLATTLVRRQTKTAQNNFAAGADHPDRSGQLLVVLQDPTQTFTEKGDVVSYHFVEADAIIAAETFTRQHRRRAIVAILLWDELWL